MKEETIRYTDKKQIYNQLLCRDFSVLEILCPSYHHAIDKTVEFARSMLHWSNDLLKLKSHEYNRAWHGCGSKFRNFKMDIAKQRRSVIRNSSQISSSNHWASDADNILVKPSSELIDKIMDIDKSRIIKNHKITMHHANYY